MILYLLWLLGVALVRRVPLRISYAVAARAGDAAWWLLPGKRRNTIDNMLHVAGRSSPLRARVLGRRSFENYAKYIVDFMRLSTAAPDEIMARIEFDQWAELDAELNADHGKIFVLMHVGNWDIGAVAIAHRGHRLSVIAETQPQGRLNQAIVAARTIRGTALLPMERAATGIIRAMKRNEALAILIDRPLTEGGVEVEFFGGMVRIPEGPARIAIRTGAKVIPISLIRMSGTGDRVRAILDFSLETLASGDTNRDIRHLTQQIMASQERVIGEYPDQWYMFRRMWPHGSPDTWPAPVSVPEV